jgi:hypothetical protein
VYDWLLFLHVTAAFALVVTVVIFSAFAVGAASDSRVLAVANVLWAIGGVGTLVLGIWLAIYVKSYDLLDGWIIAAIVLWVVASALGGRAQADFSRAGGEAASAPAVSSQTALVHWLRSLAVLALLVVMIYKPGA